MPMMFQGSYRPGSNFNNFYLNQLMPQQRFMRRYAAAAANEGSRRRSRYRRPKLSMISSGGNPNAGMLASKLAVAQGLNQPRPQGGLSAAMMRPQRQTARRLPVRPSGGGGVMGPDTPGASPVPPGTQSFGGGATGRTPGTGIIRDMIGDFQQKHDEANRVNEERYGDILGRYQQRYDKGMKLADAAANQRYRHEMAAVNQDLTNRGLRASTLAGTEASKAYERNNMIRLNQHNATSGDMLGFMERREDVGPDLGMMANMAMAAGLAENQNASLQQQMAMIQNMLNSQQGSMLNGAFPQGQNPYFSQQQPIMFSPSIRRRSSIPSFGGFARQMGLGSFAPRRGRLSSGQPSVSPNRYMNNVLSNLARKNRLAQNELSHDGNQSNERRRRFQLGVPVGPLLPPGHPVPQSQYGSPIGPQVPAGQPLPQSQYGSSIGPQMPIAFQIRRLQQMQDQARAAGNSQLAWEIGHQLMQLMSQNQGG